MNRKLILGYLVILLLVPLTVSIAIAAPGLDSLKGYFETVRAMEMEGEIARWSVQDQVKLINAMVKARLVEGEDERVKTLLDESRPLEERRLAADTLVCERYGDTYFDSYSVEETELPLEQRTKEQQAEFDQWSADFWAKWDVRGKQPLTEGSVYRESMNNLTEVGDFPRSLLRCVQVSYEWSEKKSANIVTVSIDKALYLSTKTAEQSSCFDAECSFGKGDLLCYQFLLDEYGQFLGFCDAGKPENRAEITLEEGQKTAEEALQARWHLDAAALLDMEFTSFYAEGRSYNMEEGRFEVECVYTWRDKEENPLYTVSIDAKTGSMTESFSWRESDEMRERESVWLTELESLLKNAGVSDTLFNGQGKYFWSWTLAEKAQWSQIARPIVQRYLAEHAEYAQYLEDIVSNQYLIHEWNNLFSLTQYAYGIPDNAAITQEKAFAIASEAAVAAGAKQGDVDDNPNHIFYYDVTDPAHPLWKVDINLIFGADDAKHPHDPTAPWGYFVVMDAYTGEIVKLITRTVNTSIWEIV